MRTGSRVHFLWIFIFNNPTVINGNIIMSSQDGMACYFTNLELIFVHIDNDLILPTQQEVKYVNRQICRLRYQPVEPVISSNTRKRYETELARTEFE